MKTELQTHLNLQPYFKEDFALLQKWVNINSGTYHIAGLNRMLQELKQAYQVLGGHQKLLALPPKQVMDSRGEIHFHPLGSALRIQKRPEAPIQIILSGHYDTVYPEDHPFQKGEQISAKQYRGPGAADMKGGLVILLRSIITLEKSPWASNIGWEVLLVPDEEIGSVGSLPLFQKAEGKYQVGFLYEPSYADGSFVSQRKSSTYFSVRAKGTPAHVGREFAKGKNAIQALAKVIVQSEELMKSSPSTILNIGEILGGKAINVVPDEALFRANLRVDSKEEQVKALSFLKKLTKDVEKKTGVSLIFTEHDSCPPKPFDTQTRLLFDFLKICTDELGVPFSLKPSGGTCDGNYLAAAGIPNIDTLGTIGGNIHTPDEFIEMESLTSRAQLSSLLLLKLASGELSWH